MKKIVFTGGGTVGHVTLNLLLMPKFIEDGWEVHYIGDKHGIEHQEILKSGFGCYFPFYCNWEVASLFFLAKYAGCLQSWLGNCPIALYHVTIASTGSFFKRGGFVSVPPVIAARVSGVPVFIHESDLSMGLANKIAYKFATKMYSTFEQAAGLAKVEHVGAVTKVSDQKTPEPDELVDIQTHFNPKLPTVLFVGGSAGARVFNQLVTDHKQELTERYNIINLTGDSSLNELSQNLFRVDYVTDLYQPLMEMADVVVTRGGANTIFELLAMAKLHLIVPLGREASRGDQIENAAYFVKKGYAEELQESDLTLESLEDKLSHLLSHKDQYQASMKASTELKSLADFYDLLRKDLA